jgi:hypothetical protein
MRDRKTRARMPVKRIGQASSITLQKMTLIAKEGEKLFKFFIVPSIFALPLYIKPLLNNL